MKWTPKYTEQEVREAIENSMSKSAALRLLGLRPVGSNFQTLRRLIDHYGISTMHFDPNWTRRGRPPDRAFPLQEVLVERSTYSAAS